MAIELSNLTFTEQDDIVPTSGVEQIFNTGIANTLAGKDIITGTGGEFGLVNYGTLNTGDGNDTIAGTGLYYGIINNLSSIDTGKGNDIITGTDTNRAGYGIINYSSSTIDTGDGNDTITGIGTQGIHNYGAINTGNGEDSIISDGLFYNTGGVSLGDGNDIITAIDSTAIPSITGAINSIAFQSDGLINTGNGEDSIICHGELFNLGGMFLGDGNDLIMANTDLLYYSLANLNTIDTGDGDDIITSTGIISNYNYNGGVSVINTGNGKDSLIADGGFDGSGNVFLGNGQDYLKGFGSGNFNGGNGKDTLELTSGSYTVGISGTALNFTKGSITMNTSEFDILKAGNTIYNCDNLINGQTIFVS